MPETVRFLAPADLADVVRGLAVVCRLHDPEYPDVTFRVDPASALAAGRWQDFAGNRAHFLFLPAGSVVLGFDHESPMSPHATAAGPADFRAWPGVYDRLPPPLLAAVRANPFGDPEVDPAAVTFCLWTLDHGKDWHKGDIAYPEREYGDPDGERYTLGRLGRYADDFAAEFAKTYPGRELDPDAVAEFLSGDRISVDCLRGLNPGCDPDACRGWLAGMGLVLDPTGPEGQK